jgi:hypothetical protein
LSKIDPTQQDRHLGNFRPIPEDSEGQLRLPFGRFSPSVDPGEVWKIGTDAGAAIAAELDRVRQEKIELDMMKPHSQLTRKLASARAVGRIGSACFFFLLVMVRLLEAGTTREGSITDWQLAPSLKYDALCILNALSGDPYYLRYYQADYDHFHPLFTPQEQAAFVQLKSIIKDQGQEIISAKLALYFSVVNDETLAAMVQTAHDSSRMESALRKTSYWNADSWQNYQASRAALEIALRALIRVGFPDYWAANAQPRIKKRIAELSGDLPKYDVIPVIEGYLGFPLPSHSIQVYLLAYSEPHGIRITGLRFLTHLSYPFPIVLHNAIHESMHPPYRAEDPNVHDAIDLLGKDPTIMDRVQHHDPSFGYNTSAGYIEEDSVQALEQLVSEKFGVSHNPCKYWKEQDGGMHVLAAALYAGYKAAQSENPEPYSRWFVHAVGSGLLRGNSLTHTIQSFFVSPDCDKEK